MRELEEPEYITVLDRIYQKGSTVAYPNLANSFEESYARESTQTREEYYQRKRILHEIPDSRSLLPISSMEEYEISQAIRTLRNAGLVEETDQREGIPFGVMENHSDSINYIRLTRKGFEVAHDRGIRQRQQEISERVADLTEQQNESSRLVAVVTIVIGATAVVQATAAVISLTSPLSIILGAVYLGVLAILYSTRGRWYSK